MSPSTMWEAVDGYRRLAGSVPLALFSLLGILALTDNLRGILQPFSDVKYGHFPATLDLIFCCPEMRYLERYLS